MADKFGFLFSPKKIANLEIKNRIVMAPMGTRYASQDGLVTERICQYYAARARGGVGLVIVEATYVQFPWGKETMCQLSVSEDACIPGLSRLAEAIKKNGARAALQLCYSGASATTEVIGTQPVAASVVTRKSYELPRELSNSEIKEIIKCFIKGAERVKKAGFDAVEVHGGHGHLIGQFLSPVWNFRTDEYGGSLENRLRIGTEIIEGIKAKLGDFALLYRINGIELGTDYFGSGIRGLTHEEAKEAARLIVKAGVDAVNVSCFGYGTYSTVTTPNTPGTIVPYAAGIKAVVPVPVLVAGRITPEVAEKALKEGKTDFVVMGRPLIADPEIPLKTREGRLEDIKPCIGCQHCMDIEEDLSCAVNPLLGKEGQYELKPVLAPQRVIVVGGGPAGMEAATVAALRGHKVTLFEANQKLGGQLNYADVAPDKGLVGELKEFLIRRLEKSKVKVKAGKRVSVELVEKEKPDVVIIATGATPSLPPIAGIDKSQNIISALDILAGKAQTGERVSIIGGETIACETAEILSAKGKKVTIITRNKYLATRLHPFIRHALVSRLREHNVRFLRGVQFERIEGNKVEIINSEGNKEAIEADTIVYASGSEPDKELYENLKGRFKAQLIGDCSEPRDIKWAIREGFKAGYEIP